MGYPSPTAHWAHIGGFVFGLLRAKLGDFEDKGQFDYHLDEARRVAKREMNISALTKYDRALRIDVDNIEVMAEMAPLLAETGEEEKANRFYQLAVNKMLEADKRDNVCELVIDAYQRLKSPDQMSLNDWTGSQWLLRQKLVIASSWPRDFIANWLKRPILPIANRLFCLCQVLQKQKRFDEAKSVYRRFLGMHPGSERANFARNNLSVLERLEGQSPGESVTLSTESQPDVNQGEGVPKLPNSYDLEAMS